MPYAYMLRVRLPIRRPISSESTEVTFTWLGRNVRISAADGTSSIGDAEWIVFSSSGFNDHSSAESHGQSLKNHLRLAAVKSGTPLNLGKETK